jgi:hypothetical protein
VRHDLQAFSRSIVALIKTSGDTGDSGDKANKSNSYASLPVSTNSEILSPLDPEWRHALPGRGDRISVHLEVHDQNVPTVATVPTDFEGGQALEDVLFGGLAIMRAADPLEGFSFAMWRHICDDGEAFARGWAAQAAGLGWTVLDIFGVHPLSPAGRVGWWGVALLIQGGEIDALTGDRATIRRRSGARLTWRRCNAVERVPIWQLLRDAYPCRAGHAALSTGSIALEIAHDQSRDQGARLSCYIVRGRRAKSLVRCLH